MKWDFQNDTNIISLFNAHYKLSSCATEISVGRVGSVSGVAVRLLSGRSRVRISVVARDFSLLHYIQPGSVSHPASYAQGIGVLSRG